MVEKQYKLFKTAKKTAIENNLGFSQNRFGKNVLVDFSALNEIVISETEKEIIKFDTLKSATDSSYDAFYGAEIDNFTSCIGHVVLYRHNVYNTQGKRLYVIIQVAKVKHIHLERKNIFSEWEKTVTKYAVKYGEPPEYLEIT